MTHRSATGTLNVLHQAVRAGVRRVVYAASSAYGTGQRLQNRIGSTEVLSPYAAAKLAGEHYCQAFFHSFGLETIGLRYFNVFGPRQDPASPYSAVIPLFVTALLRGQHPVIYGDGGQSRDFVFVGNVVRANLLAAHGTAGAGRVFNVGQGRQTSLLQLLQLLAEYLGCSVAPQFEPARVGDVRQSVADITAAQ